MIDFGQLLTPEVTAGIRLIVLVFAVLHVLIGLILFRQVISIRNILKTPHGPYVKLLVTVHILVLICILLFVVFY
jgi:hypothetical protein